MTDVDFGELFEIIRNGLAVKQDDSSGGVPITRIETIASSAINPVRVGFAGLRSSDYAHWLLKEGDILFSHINSVEHVGKCALYLGNPEKIIHGMNLLCLRPKREVLDPAFAVRLMRTPRFRSEVRRFANRAVNQASISIGNLRAIKVEIPSIVEQERIAALLDHLDTLRAQRRQAITLLGELSQSIFLDMFGDPRVNPRGFTLRALEGLVDSGDRINYGVVQPGGEVEGGVRLIRAGDLKGGVVDRSRLMRIAPAVEAKYTRSRVRGNEILIGCVGAIGAVSIVGPEDVGCNIARAVARVPVGEKIARGYLASYLRTGVVQQYFQKELRTVAQPTLNIKQIKETPVLVPPSELQEIFMRRMEAVEDRQRLQEESLATLDELFTSLQQRAFAGKLWDHEAA
ncbi:restriction endonuclease subunit S [Streptomyces sp. NPDC032472]|uniref:restriction endonuclease subunit S n=1 Tax=Streptomyces sp. NPDC032472 TaxID=3155018 RepID=UPI0034117A7E